MKPITRAWWNNLREFYIYIPEQITPEKVVIWHNTQWLLEQPALMPVTEEMIDG